MKSDKKAERYVKEGRVFPLQKTPFRTIYGVEGETGVWTVIHDDIKDIWTCDCKNVRNIPCSHIKAVHKYNETERT